MKLFKKIISAITALILIVNFSVFGVFKAFANVAMPDVDYYSCLADKDGAGILETWYILEQGGKYSHYSHDMFVHIYRTTKSNLICVNM